MNGTQTIDQRVAYVESVGRALGELDPEDRTAILDDVREHVAAVLAEDPDVELVDRLGAPNDFARDLLEAAGLVASPAPRVGWRVRLARLKASRPGRGLARARREFAPAIAVLRGMAAVWLLSWLLGGNQTPHLAVLLLLGGVAGWLLSPRYEDLISSNGRAGRGLSIVADLVTALVAIVMAAAWATGLSPAQPSSYDAEYWGDPVQNGWAGAIQPFGPDGTSAPVALYDQDGNPLLTDSQSFLYCGDYEYSTPIAVPYLNSAGQSMDNVSPVRGVCVDEENVVLGEASAIWNEPLVQEWSTAGMPQVGQMVVIDEFGAFAGMALDPAASPSPIPSGPPAQSGSPAPSGDPSPAASAPEPAPSVAADPEPGAPPAPAG